MAYISEKSGQKYYKFLLDCHNMDSKLETKVPYLKNKLENEILAEITNLKHFYGDNGQMKWLLNNQISGYQRMNGFIPEDIVSGIIYIFKKRNIAEHGKETAYAEYLFIFYHIAKTISLFSDISIPNEINNICNPNEYEKIKISQNKKEKNKNDEIENENIIEEIVDKCIIIKIKNETINRRGGVYEAVRYFWTAKLENAEKADYVLAVVKGIVKGIYKPNSWYIATIENVEKYGGKEYYSRMKHSKRIGFIGEEADDEIKNRYFKKILPKRYMKTQNPIQYTFEV